MAKDTQQRAVESPERIQIRFSLFGLAIFSATLVMATGLLVVGLARLMGHSGQGISALARGNDPAPAKSAQDLPPWGELITRDVEIERPEEYLALEANTDKVPAWRFATVQPQQVKDVMTSYGLSAQQVERAMSAQLMSVTSTNIIVKPDEDLILSLTPDVRAKFYGELAKNPDNYYMRYPYCFTGESFDDVVKDSEMDPATIKLIRSLLYRNGNAEYFSDFEMVMHRLPDEQTRIDVVKTLSRQSAVFVRLRIQPDTDVQKLATYWASAPNVRYTDVLPLLESVKNSDEGGSLSLLFLLPPFARERLYTFPLPSQPGDTAMDCHWSSLNFFNQTPDNRFSDPNYTASYIVSHYYPVEKATHYGDLIFLLDDKGNAIHSAVYIADDVVFTKNGNNYRQPWMLMRLNNMVSTFSVQGKPRVVIYRNKET